MRRGHVVHTIRSYEYLLERAVGRSRYWDAAYVNGYLVGLTQLLIDDEDLKDLPLFELFSDPVYWPEGGGREDLDDAVESDDTAPKGQEDVNETEPDPDGGNEPTEYDELVNAEIGEVSKKLPRIRTQVELLEMLDGFTEDMPEIAACL